MSDKLDWGRRGFEGSASTKNSSGGLPIHRQLGSIPSCNLPSVMANKYSHVSPSLRKTFIRFSLVTLNFISPPPLAFWTFLLCRRQVRHLRPVTEIFWVVIFVSRRTLERALLKPHRLVNTQAARCVLVVQNKRPVFREYCFRSDRFPVHSLVISSHSPTLTISSTSKAKT